MNILHLFIFCLVPSFSLGNNAAFIRNGYIFKPKGAMFPTTTIFKLIVTLNKHTLSNHLHNLHSTSSMVLQYFNDTSTETTHSPQNLTTNSSDVILSRKGHNSHQLRQLLRQELSTVLNHVNLLTSLFSQQEHPDKEKQAILPWIGKLNSFLFGSPTDERVDVLQDKINKLEDFNFNNLHYIQSHEAILNNTITVVNSLVDNVNKLAQIGKLLQSEKQYISRLAEVAQHMSQDSMLLASLSLLNSVVSEVKTQAYRLTEAITQARQNSLSSSLLPHDQFLQTLQNISNTHSLFIEPTSSTLPIFYKIANVELHNTDNMFIFEIVLPLRDHFTNPLSLYHVTPYMFPHIYNGTLSHESVYLILPETKGLLAVAQSGLNTMIEKGQPNCKSINQNSLIVCFSVVLYNLPASCPASIFLQRPIDHQCTPSLVPHPRTTFYNFGPQHLYVAPNSRRASLSCYPSNGPPSSKTIMLQTQGFMTIPKLCTLSIDSTLVPAPTSTDVQVQINLPMPLTDLSINIPQDSSSLIMNNRNIIRKMLNISTLPINLDKITSHLSQIKDFDHIPSITTTVTLSTTAVVCIGVTMAITIFTLNSTQKDMETSF